ncbi:unnamed protein product [Cylicocyclus nassatus]|uniref:Uncharacterized protein n=1 Tax=Cylicocyclus nassatus TaxID=53992 RepID=A0AA36M8G6_CYLNA|nr:unnamed protein product [Cylicocyclus nassatus]
MASFKFLFITLLALMFICSTSVQGMRHGMHHRPGRPGPGHRPRPGHRPGPFHRGPKHHGRRHRF